MNEEREMSNLALLSSFSILQPMTQRLYAIICSFTVYKGV
jgi:hypothetical protein